MGKRGWTFFCLDCENEWGTWFDHLPRDEMLEWLTSTVCEECGSKNWKFTEKTRFAGGRTRRAKKIVIRCQDDFTTTGTLEIGGKHRKEVIYEAENKNCPSCSQDDWKFEDEIVEL